jgi:thymidylate synthase
MKQYLDLVNDVLNNGNQKGDRTGTGTLSVFGRQLRFNLEEGFPLLTTKRMAFKSIVHELIWFLSGDQSIQYLKDNDCKIWDDWAHNERVGPMYGSQWINWESWTKTQGWLVYNQIDTLINQLNDNPNSRRMLVSAWNVPDLPDESLSPKQNVQNGFMALAPCHVLFQCYVSEGKLSLQVYQRSADLMLGVPFNIASYGLLLMLLAQQSGLEPGELIWTGGDIHIYNNHIDQAKEQLTREPLSLPTVLIDKQSSIYDYRIHHFHLNMYVWHAPLKLTRNV